MLFFSAVFCPLSFFTPNVNILLFSGLISTRVLLDREEKSLYELTVLARDSGRPPREKTATVRVAVTDVNDNAPHIVEPRQPSISVREEQPIGYEVVMVCIRHPREPVLDESEF